MKRASIIISSFGLFALVLALDAMKTHIFSHPQGFEAGASVAVLFWLGLGVSVGGILCCGVHLALKKLVPWKSGAFAWCSIVLLCYGLMWFFPPNGF